MIECDTQTLFPYNSETLLAWFNQYPNHQFMLGYGSLMSHHSRAVYSNIHCPAIPVKVKGFERGWVTRAYHEHQTYVGAWHNEKAHFNAQILPVEFDPDFHKREQDYEFVSVKPQQIEFSGINTSFLDDVLIQKKFWICQTREAHPADLDFPVYASYVATCLSGCLESGDLSQISQFFDATSHWPEKVQDDLDKPHYPRSAKLSPERLQTIKNWFKHYELW